MGKYENPIPELEEEIVVQNVKKIERIKDYEESKDYEEHQCVYFAFIDILGFKKEFDDNKDSENTEFSEKFRVVFNYFFELMEAANFMRGDDSYAGQTSDSLYFYTPRADKMLNFLNLFTHFNLYAMTQNVFFRGGVGQGTLFRRDKYQFYGSSVIHAYLLESVIAKNPVIYIDEATYYDLKKYDECNELIRKGKERYYLRPFAGIDIDAYQYLKEDATMIIRETPLEIIKENITNNKKKFEYDEKNFGKYVFLIDELKEIKK